MRPTVRFVAVLFALATCLWAFTTCQQPDNAQAESARMPAEWEPHDAVWLGWSGQPGLPGRDSVSANIVKALQPHVAVRICYADAAMRRAAATLLHRLGADTARVEWFQNAQYSFWMRDPGPLFRTDGRVANFRWANYGVRLIPGDGRLDPVRPAEGLGDDAIARHLGQPLVPSNVALEGGAIETNGRGTLLSIAEMARQRNPGQSLAHVSQEMTRLLGGRHVVWLARSTYHDRIVPGPTVANYFIAGANGHIDEVVRFVNDSTVVVAEISAEETARHPLARLDKPILDDYARTLSRTRLADGRPFRVVRVPCPALAPLERAVRVTSAARRQFHMAGLRNGDTARYVPAVSYLNFLVSNNVVLLPAYWRPGLPATLQQTDAQAGRLFATLFPGRKLVRINPLAVNRGGGGIHCITQQQPVQLSTR